MINFPIFNFLAIIIDGLPKIDKISITFDKILIIKKISIMFAKKSENT